jgi:hypothetical protein
MGNSLKIIPVLKKFDLVRAMDLDFGLPASLQRGTEILFSEGLYTLWTARNEVTFGRRQHDGSSARELAVRRIKVRLKAEYRLHGFNTFKLSGLKTGGGVFTKRRRIFILMARTLHSLFIGRTTVSCTGDRQGLNCREKCVLPSSYTARTTQSPFSVFSSSTTILY